MSSHTHQIAEFAANPRLADLPAEDIARAKSIMFAGLGCGLFGSNARRTKLMASVVDGLELWSGCSSVWVCGRTASATSAARLNGAMIQGYELDGVDPTTSNQCKPLNY